MYRFIMNSRMNKQVRDPTLSIKKYFITNVSGIIDQTVKDGQKRS
jgi:hypothetical protein